MSATPIRLTFDGGTIIATGSDPQRPAGRPGGCFDQRPGSYRAEGRCYRAIVEHIRKQRWPYTDEARNYEPTPWPMQVRRDPRPHQSEALEAWWQSGGRGVVVLP